MTTTPGNETLTDTQGLETALQEAGADILASLPAASLPFVARRLYNRILALEYETLQSLRAFIGPRTGIEFPAQAQAVEPRRPKPRYQVVNDVAIIPVLGELVHRSSWMDADSGLVSYETIARDLDAATIDPEVRSSILLIDSGGGEVAGLPEFAARVRAAHAIKPVTALADGMAASAAYWTGAAAGKFFVSPGSITGSIGVIYLHVDAQAANERKGFVIEEIFAGAQKVDLSPHSTLTPERRARIQAHIDTFYGLFVSAVARYRGLAEAAVRATEAGIFIGEDGARAGLVDGVATLDELLAGSLSTTLVQVAAEIRPATEEDPMETVTELRAAYGALVAEIEAEARATERARIKSIFTIAAPTQRATAEALAFESEATEGEAAIALMADLKQQAQAHAFYREAPEIVAHAPLESEQQGDAQDLALLAAARSRQATARH